MVADGSISFPEPRHDHAACSQDALDHAEAICRDRGLRLTPLRRRVLELVLSGHRPLGAYDILENLRQDHKSAQPPTVYRALEFLVGHGLVHRIESLNAFVACFHGGVRHVSQFLICRECGTVAEIVDPRIDEAIKDTAQNSGFVVSHSTVEIEGQCRQCAAKS